MKKIELDVEVLQDIIKLLEQLQEIRLLELTNWNKIECTEDRKAIAVEYIEVGDLINWLKEK